MEELRAQMETPSKSIVVGRREWISLPDLGIVAIKAKIDTGAKTSSLHARSIELFGSATHPRVRFIVHPIPMRAKIAIACEADVIAERTITSSNGAQEKRIIIETAIQLGDRTWRVETGLTDRTTMTYRCLLGRQAIPPDMLVDPASSFLQQRLSSQLYRQRRAP
jgi:ribosomal protein S6--L-glutamate ligase